MFSGGSIIKDLMTKRGFKHRRQDDQFLIRGEYARNLQYVYSKSYSTTNGAVVDLVYFGVDIFTEKLVIGLYRENPDIENGIILNATRSLSLREFTKEDIGSELDKLIPSVRYQL